MPARPAATRVAVGGDRSLVWNEHDPPPPHARTSISRRMSSLPRLALVVLIALACAPAASDPAPEPVVARTEADDRTSDPHLALALRVLRTTPLVDGHNDLPWAIRESESRPRDVEAYDLRRRTSGHTDLERLRRGLVGGQFWSVYIPGDIADSGFAR